MTRHANEQQIAKVAGIANWLEKAWKAVNQPEHGVDVVDVRELVGHLKGFKPDSVKALVAQARDAGDASLKNAALDGAILNDVLTKKRDSRFEDGAVRPGVSALTPLLKHGQPMLWFGGEQPVSDDTIVHAITNDGAYYPDFAARHLDWGLRTDGRDIVAYVVDPDPYRHLRLAAAAGKCVEYKDPRGFWVESGFMHYPENFQTTEPVNRFRIATPDVLPETVVPRQIPAFLLRKPRKKKTGVIKSSKGLEEAFGELGINEAMFIVKHPGLGAELRRRPEHADD